MKKSWFFSSCLLCIFVTIGLCSYWCYRYWLDEDTSVVNYTKFYESSENVFPTMSLCIDNPFNSTRLAEYGSNQTTYSAFLAGELFSIELMNINYTYVSTDIADFIKGYEVHFKNATKIKVTSGLSSSEKKLLTVNSFNGFLSWTEKFVKCFAFVIPQYRDLESFKVHISNQLFPNGLRRWKFRAAVHLPNQLLLSWFSCRYTWHDQAKSSRYKTRAFVRSMDVVVNRNKKDKECNEHWRSYDDWVAQKHIEESACRNPYQGTEKGYEKCQDKDKMFRAKFYQDIVSRNNYNMPCRIMQNVHLDWTENNYDDVDEGTFGDFWIGLYFLHYTFKEIVQTR